MSSVAASLKNAHFPRFDRIKRLFNKTKLRSISLLETQNQKSYRWLCCHSSRIVVVGLVGLVSSSSRVVSQIISEGRAVAAGSEVAILGLDLGELDAGQLAEAINDVLANAFQPRPQGQEYSLPRLRNKAVLSGKIRLVDLLPLAPWFLVLVRERPCVGGVGWGGVVLAVGVVPF